MEQPEISQRINIALLLAFAAAAALAVLLLARQVAHELRLLSTANSDNVQWSLAQSEVEFLQFRNVLATATRAQSPDLEALRKDFDIFFSRISTLEQGRIYADLRASPDFANALANIRAYLNTNVTTIDAEDGALARALPDLLGASQDLVDDVRSLSTVGLTQFAMISDDRRGTISNTLLKLGFVTIELVTALCILALYSNQVRKRAIDQGRALSETNARMNAVLSASIDAVILADAEGHVIDINAAAEEIFGYPLSEAQGRKISELIVPEGLRQAHEDGMRRVRETGKHRLVGSGRVRLDGQRADGTLIPVELALRVIDRDGAPLFIGFLRDISANVTAERELVEARDRALAGEKAKADFLAVMSHEIRTPLNGILGNVALLQDSALDSDQTRYVHNMDISGQVLMDHVDAVLDLTRFATGKVTLNSEPVNIGQLLQDVVDSQESRALEQDNRLRWSWVGSPVDWIDGDRSAIQQIVLNLVSNALKFTQHGDVDIEAEYHRRSTTGTKDEIELRVIDSGAGILEADLPHIFEDFRTTDPSFGRSAGGTGLGLGIAKRLAKAMHGEIGVESTPGEGCVFWVAFPAPPSTPPSKTRPTAVPKTAETKLRILVVDDNEINLDVTRDMLRRLGHDVDAARNGREAVQTAVAQEFDLILMDIAMPEMDGLEATTRIRDSQGASTSAPIVALSANVMPEDRQRFLAAGMQEALTKPLNQKILFDLLEQVGLMTDRPEISSAPIEIPPELRLRFETEVRALIDWLSKTDRDRQEIAQRCHQAAGTAAVFGEDGLRNALISLQNAAKGNASREELSHEIAEVTHAGQRITAVCI